MGLPRFYAENLSSGRRSLDPAEARHAQASRRLAAGDAIMLFDGHGREASAVIVETGKRGVEVDVGPIGHRPRPALQLTLAVALPKATRQDVLIEKCTELGVAAIVPLITERSISGASEHRVDKWRRTAIEAAKQSDQAWIPDLAGPTPLAQVIATFGNYDTVCVATAEATRAFQPPAAGRVLVLIGPEGDWTPRELEQMQAAGAMAVSLGPNILRVETAAVAVSAACHLAALPQPQEPTPAAGTHV